MTDTRTTTKAPPIDYPDSDGKPMAESEFQLVPIIDTAQVLKAHFQHHDDVYVVGNLVLYYEEHDTRDIASVAPDVFVVRGVPTHKRRSYRVWDEGGKAPDWVLEVTSRRTRGTDQGRKRELYAQLGVQEYWLYDPTGDYLTPPLQGLELVGDIYQPMALRERPSGVLSGDSLVLGLELRLDQGELRFHDPATGQTLRTYQEAEARVAELEARLRTLEGPQEP